MKLAPSRAGQVAPPPKLLWGDALRIFSAFLRIFRVFGLFEQNAHFPHFLRICRIFPQIGRVMGPHGSTCGNK